MKKLLGISGAILLVGAPAGCSSDGYPKPERRIEEVENTIKNKSLSGETNDGRKTRFDTHHSRAVGGTN